MNGGQRHDACNAEAFIDIPNYIFTGAYSPRKTMKYDHVNPAEAVLIHQDLNSRFSFGIHWGTFKLTLESYMEPKIKLLELVQSQPNLPTFAVFDIGETTETLPISKLVIL